MMLRTWCVVWLMVFTWLPMDSLTVCASKNDSPRKSEFALHVTTDFYDDLLYGHFDEPRMREMMRMFRSWGVSRIYWIGDSMEDRWFESSLRPEVVKNARLTHEKIGEFIPAAVKYAHEQGMELYVEFKPFDLYIPVLTPGSPKVEIDRKGLPVLGGRLFWGSPWLEAHREYLFARNMTGIRPGIDQEPIGKIVFVKADDKPTSITRDNLELFVSSDNVQYRKYDKPYSFTNAVVERPEVIKGVNLNRRGPGKETVRVLTLSGLEIREPFVAFSTKTKTDGPSFQNHYYKLVELYTPQGEPIPLTYGLAPGPDDWFVNFGNPKDKSFPDKGFSFGTCGYLGSCLKPQNMIEEIGYLDPDRKVLAVSKGVNPYLPALNPVYPEVRNYWLSRIQKFIDWKVDGISLRWPGHQDCQDWDAYGFNAPVVAEYKKKYGVNILTQEFDKLAWRKLMGEHYTDFYRQAKSLLAKHGKKLQVDVLFTNDPARVPPCEHYCNVYLDWPTWFSFTDSVTLRRYVNDFDLSPFLKVARKYNLPTYYSVWSWNIWKGKTPSEMAAEIQKVKDQGVNGFILYEGCALYRLKPDGTFYQPREDLIAGTLHFLGRGVDKK